MDELAEGAVGQHCGGQIAGFSQLRAAPPSANPMAISREGSNVGKAKEKQGGNGALANDAESEWIGLHDYRVEER